VQSERLIFSYGTTDGVPQSAYAPCLSTRMPPRRTVLLRWARPRPPSIALIVIIIELAAFQARQNVRNRLRVPLASASRGNASCVGRLRNLPEGYARRPSGPHG
jgi:hypothetical protein